MREDKLFTTTIAQVSTAGFHAKRERANHWDESHQRPRMEMALQFVGLAIEKLKALDEVVTLSDLGCGDGGMLAQVVARWPEIEAWGYDFQPANVNAAIHERHLNVKNIDVFNLPPLAGASVYAVNDHFGRIAVMTEVLEHLNNPREVLWNLAGRDHTRYAVVSSPVGESHESHDACHAWAWDFEGYERLVAECGWRVMRHEIVDWSQVMLVQQAGWGA